MLLYLAAVHTYWGQRLDEHAFEGRGILAGDPSRGADRLLSAISVGTLLLAIAALILLAALQRRPALGLLAFAVVAGSLLVTELLKHELLSRPLLVATPMTENSLPSGHTTIAVAVGLATLLVVPPRLRGLAALGAGALAIGVGIATVAAGWHRPSDVIAAYLVAAAVAGLLAALAVARVPRAAPQLERAGPSAPLSPAALLPLAAVGVVSTGLGLLAVARAVDVPLRSAGLGFLLAAIAIAAAGALVTAGLLLALRPAGRPAG